MHSKSGLTNDIWQRCYRCRLKGRANDIAQPIYRDFLFVGCHSVNASGEQSRGGEETKGILHTYDSRSFYA